MRLLNDVRKVAVALGLSAMLAACGGGSGKVEVASASNAVRPVATNGPEADYPQVLGEPFTVDGQTYTPEDTFSYDSVGYATLDPEGGQGVSVAHKTLPMPSYVELTALDTGRTILARVERRGPMTSQRIVGLSQGAQAQLGVAEGAPVRIRRVNPQEFERARLRAGEAVAARLDTPDTLLAVLKKNLPAAGSASLAGPVRPTGYPASGIARTDSAPVAPQPVAVAASRPAVAAATPASVEASFDSAFKAPRRANASYPLPPIAGASAPMPAVAQASRVAPAAAAVTRSTPRELPASAANAPAVQRYSLPGVQTAAAPPQRPQQAVSAVPRSVQGPGDGAFVVQAAAFSSKANAERLANQFDGGFVMQSGKFYRVHVGPYATRGQAEAALAKVRAAGYSDARVFSAG